MKSWFIFILITKCRIIPSAAHQQHEKKVRKQLKRFLPFWPAPKYKNVPKETIVIHVKPSLTFSWIPFHQVCFTCNPPNIAPFFYFHYHPSFFWQHLVKKFPQFLLVTQPPPTTSTSPLAFLCSIWCIPFYNSLFQEEPHQTWRITNIIHHITYLPRNYSVFHIKASNNFSFIFFV